MVYEGRREVDEIKYVVSERDGRGIRDLLVAHLSNFGIPIIR